MGLTIHYQLRPAGTHEGIDDLQARWVAQELRKLALKFKRAGRLQAVGQMGFTPDLRRLASEWRTRPVPGQPHTFTGDEIRPLAGHLFRVSVGRGCEPLLLGLCRYPRGGWRLKSFCKTQYASLHGWEHFLRCHTAVIDLLAGARRLGFGVKISDEGDYWPRRSVKALQANLEELNAAVAAAAGALKDAAEASGSPGVQSPIFTHAQFERLEAEGEARGHASRLRRLLR
jgi:hypothetical protein